MVLFPIAILFWMFSFWRRNVRNCPKGVFRRVGNCSILRISQLELRNLTNLCLLHCEKIHIYPNYLIM